MLSGAIWDRAVTIFKRKQIRLKPGSSRTFFSFFVQQRSGKETTVDYYLNRKTNNWEYQCHAISHDKRWACCLVIKDKTEAQCSHSLAVKLYMKIIKERLPERKHEE